MIRGNLQQQITVSPFLSGLNTVGMMHLKNGSSLQLVNNSSTRSKRHFQITMKNYSYHDSKLFTCKKLAFVTLDFDLALDIFIVTRYTCLQSFQKLFFSVQLLPYQNCMLRKVRKLLEPLFSADFMLHYFVFIISCWSENWSVYHELCFFFEQTFTFH